MTYDLVPNKYDMYSYQDVSLLSVRIARYSRQLYLVLYQNDTIRTQCRVRTASTTQKVVATIYSSSTGRSKVYSSLKRNAGELRQYLSAGGESQVSRRHNTQHATRNRGPDYAAAAVRIILHPMWSDQKPHSRNIGGPESSTSNTFFLTVIYKANRKDGSIFPT